MRVEGRKYCDCTVHPLSKFLRAKSLMYFGRLVSQHVFIPCHFPTPISRVFSPVTTLFSKQHCIQRMGQATSKSSGNDMILPRVPSDIKFRVLIIGRANASKTSILQRVCDTTESPEIYRCDPEGNRERVRRSGS